MLDTGFQTATRSFSRPTCCPCCGEALIAPMWSEHVSERRVRNLWACEACGYEFETDALFQTMRPMAEARAPDEHS